MNIDTVKKLLANQERTELYSIISKLSNYREDAEEWLLDYCSKKGKKSDSSLIVEKQIQHYWSVAEDIIDVSRHMCRDTFLIPVCSEA